MNERTFAERVRTAGVPDQDLARHFGVSLPTVRRWKEGHSAPLPFLRTAVYEYLDGYSSSSSR